jgi:hypothetical protein
MDENARGQLFRGVAGGLVAWWAVDRLYTRSRGGSNGAAPYWAGAAIGAAYGMFVLRRKPRTLARVPLLAAFHAASPPATGAANASETRGGWAGRLAARGLQRVAERTLFR